MRPRLLGGNAHRILRLKSRRNLIFLAVVEVQQMEAVGNGGKRLPGRRGLLAHPGRGLRVWLSAFIDLVVDLLAFVSPVTLVSLGINGGLPRVAYRRLSMHWRA